MRRNQYIGLTVLALAVLLVIYKVRGQSFGSFNHDQPYLVGPVSAVNTNLSPTNIPDLFMWWVQSDISSNANVTAWKDRYYNNWLVATNTERTPTNDSYGVYFNNDQLRLTSNSPYCLASNSMYVIFTAKTNAYGAFNDAYAAGEPGIEPLLGDQNSTAIGFYLVTNNLMVRTSAAGGSFVAASTLLWPLVPTNQVCTLTTISNKVYTNGVLAATIPASPVPLLSVGGMLGGVAALNHYYIHEIGYYSNNITEAQASNISYYAQITYATNKTPEFKPMDIGGFRFWYRADKHVYKNSSLDPAADGDSIYYFIDNGSFANNLFGNGTYNGIRQTVGFRLANFKNNGTDGSWNNIACWSIPQAYTYFVVLQCTNSLAGSQVPIGAYTAPQPFIQTVTNASLNEQVYMGSSAFSFYECPTVTNWTILTACFNGTSSFLRTNRVSRAEAFDAGTSDLCSTILANHSGSSFGFKGAFAEWIVYKGIPATNDIQRIENWLAAKYGL